jgi:hypothetical protein
MKSLLFVAALAATSPLLASKGLPLHSGTYVQSGTPCRNAPFAAMMSYDGKGLGDPHSAHCRSRILARNGDRYRVSTTCRANGDGSPTTPTTMTTTLRIPSRTSFVYTSAGSREAGSAFRLCPGM